MGTIGFTYKAFGHLTGCYLFALSQDAFREGSEKQGLLQAIPSEVQAEA